MIIIFLPLPGAIVSHQHAPNGLIVGGLAFPERIVDGVYNFFDPDTWQTAKAMSYVGNPAADREIKRILRTSGALICTRSTTIGGGACTVGQIPHHFAQPEVCGGEGDPNDCNCSKALLNGGQCPTYKALALATQTGPLCFSSSPPQSIVPLNTLLYFNDKIK